jgi:hypothetical protein
MRHPSSSYLATALLLLVFSVEGTSAQTSDSVDVVPGARYELSSVGAALAGAGYRDLWTTSIRVPVADLSELGGGLTPFRVGGGMTTQTLHLRGADGRRYVMRSVDKTPGQGLEERLQGTIVESALQDQISALHPTGALVVAKLLDAIDVLHADPRLLVIPDDPRLGDFREQFADMLVLFEERPDDGPKGTAGFAGSRKIVDTDELLKRLEDSSKNRIDANDFLRGRLVDLLVGDRDRSVNNFLWARFDAPGGIHIWRAVPRDRDQAFVEFDGALKAIGRVYESRLVTFDEEFPSIAGLTRNAWDMDRTLLVGLSRAEWDGAVQAVQGALTDEVIEEAVRAMPAEHFAKIGEDMIEKLRSRRDLLPGAADELYDLVFATASIHATDEKDVASIDRLPDGSVRVELTKRGEVESYFLREFDAAETEEIRIYLHGGADEAVVSGIAESSPLIHVIGGHGRDRLTDLSETSGVGTVFHDRGEATSFTTGPSTAVIRDHVRRPRLWREMTHDVDFGSHLVPIPALGYDQDAGIVVGGGFTHYSYGIGAVYDAKTSLRAAWAFGASTPSIAFEHYRRHAQSGVGLVLAASYSGLEVMNFYGHGNETDGDGPSSDYRISEENLSVGALLQLGGEVLSFRAGPVFKATWSDELNPPAIPDVRIGAGKFRRLGVEGELTLDTRDLPAHASSGVLLRGSGAFVPAASGDEIDGSYGYVHGLVSTYLTPFGATTLALRAGGKHVFGESPYSELAFIGGSATVRGLPKQRYAGDGALYGSVELRQRLGEVFIVFPSELGIFAFGDIGRVYADGETSDTWHKSFGGGISLAPVRREYTLSAAIARSEETTAVYVGFGLPF